jgi:hypothetical protein
MLAAYGYVPPDPFDDSQNVQTASRLLLETPVVVVMTQVTVWPEPPQVHFAILWTGEIVAKAGRVRSRRMQRVHFFKGRPQERG